MLLSYCLHALSSRSLLLCCCGHFVCLWARLHLVLCTSVVILHLSVFLCILHFFVVFVKPHFVCFCGYLHRFVVLHLCGSLCLFVAVLCRCVVIFASVVVLHLSAAVTRQARSEIHLRTWRKNKATHFWSIWSYWLFISSIIQNRCDFKFWVQTECSWSLIWPDSSSVRDTFGFLADSRASRCSWVTAASTDTSSFSMCDLFHMHEQRVCCCCWRWNLNGSDPAGTPL